MQLKPLDDIQKRLIAEVADLHKVPEGAYNFRVNGALDSRNTTENVDIRSKADGTGTSFADKAEVQGLSEDGGVVALYAQWSAKSYTIWYWSDDAGSQKRAQTAYFLMAFLSIRFSLRF